MHRRRTVMGAGHDLAILALRFQPQRQATKKVMNQITA